MSDPKARRAPDLMATLAAFAVLFGLAAFSPQVLNDADTFTHVAAGQWMLAHRAILHVDPFSYTFAGRPWQTHEWLSEILFALAYRAASWRGVMLLTGLAAGAAAGLLAWFASRWLKGAALLVALVLALGCLAPSLLARPHVLAAPFLVAWTAGLVLARDAGKAPSPWLLPLMIVWANLHASFLFGLALIAPFALEAVLAARADRIKPLTDWAIFGVFACVAAIASPHGLDNLIFPFRLLSLHGLANVGEWRGATFDGLQPFEAAVLVGFFLLVWRGVRQPMVRLLVILGLLHLSLQHGRYEFLFGMVAVLLLAPSLAQNRAAEAADPTPRSVSPMINAALALAILGGVGARLALPAPRTDALDAALSKVPPGLAVQPVFNDYGFGGYLIFKGVRPFIDSRAEVYGDPFLATYGAMQGGDLCALRANFDHYGIDWTLLPPSSPVVSILDIAPGWRRLYADRFAVVQAYDPAARPGASRIPGPACRT